MAKVITLEKPFQLRPYSKGELVNSYDISLYVLNKWIDALQPQMGNVIARTLNVKQVKLFVETYGVPGQIVSEAA